MNCAIILSGGIGSRMKMNGFPKQYIEINEKPILIYTLEIFEKCDDIDLYIIIAVPEWQSIILNWIELYSLSKFKAFALPGETRQESILNGLNQLITCNPSDKDIVIIHDAVRPLVSVELVKDCIKAAKHYGACMPVLSISDTVYQSLDGSSISDLLDRSTLFAGQAPEAFRLLDYWNLNCSISREELNSYKGSSEIAYKYGMTVRLISGEDTNFKITTQADLDRFRNKLAK